MRAPVQERAVSLWDVLTLLAECGGLGGALGAAGVAQVSGLRWALVVLWGLLLGSGCIACA